LEENSIQPEPPPIGAAVGEGKGRTVLVEDGAVDGMAVRVGGIAVGLRGVGVGEAQAASRGSSNNIRGYFLKWSIFPSFDELLISLYYDQV
jgi:hypothetical protein